MSKILIVEDNPSNIRLVVAVLENAGHQVLQAENAAEGICLAHEAHPDLLFMDIQLPGMDGLEASRLLKADEITRDIPIYALTAFAMKGDAERIRAAGCDGYLAKPVSYKDLLAAPTTTLVQERKMATNTTTDEQNSGMDFKLLLSTLIAFWRGDFSTRMPNDWTGVHGKIADTLNEIIDMAERTTGDFERVSQVVGKAGKVNARLSVADLHGSWAKLVDSSNTLIEDLVSPMNEMVRVINAVSTGDLSQNVPTQIDGKKLEDQFLKSAEMVNGIVSGRGLEAATG